MILRWIYKIWKFLWSTVVILLVAAVLLGTLLVGALQLPQSKSYIKNQLTEVFNRQYEGSLEIERISGFLPVNITAHNILVSAPAEVHPEVLSVRELTLTLNPWDLLQQEITITGFELNEPDIRFLVDETGEYAILKAFKQHDDGPSAMSPSGSEFQRFQVYAPNLGINKGKITFEQKEEKWISELPKRLVIEDVDLSMFMELSQLQRFFDIEHLSAQFQDTGWKNLTMNGQVFSDDRYLELNGISLQAGDSRVAFSAEATPVDLFAPDLGGQLMEAAYRLDLNNSEIYPEQFADSELLNKLPDHPLEIDLLLNGTLDSLYVDRFIGNMGENAVQLTGLTHSIGKQEFGYNLNLINLILQPEVFSPYLAEYMTSEEIEYLSDFGLTGQLSGTVHELQSDLEVKTPNGEFFIDGFADWGSQVHYELLLELDSLDLAPLRSNLLDSTHFNGRIALAGSGFDPEQISIRVSADLDSGYVNHIDYNHGHLTASYENRTLDHQFVLSRSDSDFQSDGIIQQNEDHWYVSVNGEMRNINLRQVLDREDLPETSLSLNFNTEIQGSNPDDLYGRSSFEVERSIIGVDSLRPHQFYIDLNSPDNPERNLRLTSSFLDAELTGDIYPGTLTKLYRHWQGYLQNQLAEEVFFDTTYIAQFEHQFLDGELPETNLNLQLELKDLDLLQKYFRPDPLFGSQARITANLNAGAERMLLTASVSDQSMRFKDNRADTINANMTASFRYNEPLKNYGTVDLQVNSKVFSYRNVEFREAFLNASMRDDSLMIQHSSKSGAENVQLDFTLLSHLLPDRLEMDLMDFTLGNEQYLWSTIGTPKFAYTRQETFEIEDLLLTSETERIEVNGIYSSDFEDSVEYRIRNLQLERISQLIDGRVTFSGIMNGDFITRSLTQIPSIQGDLQVQRFMLTDRLVGDVNINSSYEPEDERFNTQISVITDTEKYSAYYAENDSIGHNLLLDGYFRAPDLDQPDRDLFYFDADFREIDMWIVTVIIPSIIDEMEGSATGEGYVSGTLEDYDFSATFDIRDVYGKPTFVNTEYTIDGTLYFDRHDGLIFDQLDLRDPMGGSGVLTGTIDLDDFSETTYLDLTLDFDNLHFMNNPYDPDVPFYANARGTGQARLTGTNFSPFLRTTTPLQVTSNSQISVPLLDETELDQAHRFIRFVDSFDPDVIRRNRGMAAEGIEGSAFQFDPEDLTFVERFTMDIQVVANDPVTFRLIFDQVTNEVLTANGTGQLRLTLEDQTFSMFGRMNISDGEYQFVAGDIITRRFQLEEGSIIWEGDPADARLNVSANYRARPDFSTLVAGGAPTAGPGESAQRRFPIDLVLEIGGTISAIENEFYFRLPSAIEGTLDPTLSTQINALNRNEEEKLFQATSILLTGNFIPSASLAEGEPFRDNLAGGAMVVSPLLTTQLINPLLADQINSLLRSDMALDIDVNLAAFDQIDLGVALRLYNDRLILRREGQITGPQSDIGDLGATYRLNRTFSLTAFHRQDPTLATTTSDNRQTQEMNGVGVEAQVQFNSWKEFGNRITNTFRRLFGIREPEQETEDNEQLASDTN